MASIVFNVFVRVFVHSWNRNLKAMHVVWYRKCRWKNHLYVFDICRISFDAASHLFIDIQIYNVYKYLQQLDKFVNLAVRTLFDSGLLEIFI